MADMGFLYSELILPVHTTEADYIGNWGSCVELDGTTKYVVALWDANTKQHYSQENPTFQNLSARDAKLAWKIDQLIDHVGSKPGDGSPRNILHWDGSKWVYILATTVTQSYINIEDLKNTPGAVNSGDVLQSDGSSWNNIQPNSMAKNPSHGIALTDLKDVNDAPNEGEFLMKHLTGYTFEDLSSVIHHNLISGTHSDTSLLYPLASGDQLHYVTTPTPKWYNIPSTFSNVMQKMADPSGALDSTTNFLNASISGQGNLLIPVGKYLLNGLYIGGETGSFPNGRNYCFMGEGRPTLAITGSGTMIGMIGMDSFQAHGIQFLNLNSSTSYILDIDLTLHSGKYIQEVKFDHCDFLSANYSGEIKILGPGNNQHFYFTDCFFYRTKFTVNCTSSKAYFHFTNCRFFDCGSFSFTNAQVQFSGCYFDNCWINSGWTFTSCFITMNDCRSTDGSDLSANASITLNTGSAILSTGCSLILNSFNVLGGSTATFRSCYLTIYRYTFSAAAFYCSDTLFFASSFGVLPGIALSPSDGSNSYRDTVTMFTNCANLSNLKFYDADSTGGPPSPYSYYCPSWIKEIDGCAVYATKSVLQEINNITNPTLITFDRGMDYFPAPFGGINKVAVVLPHNPFPIECDNNNIFDYSSGGRFKYIGMGKKGFVKIRYSFALRTLHGNVDFTKMYCWLQGGLTSFKSILPGTLIDGVQYYNGEITLPKDNIYYVDDVGNYIELYCSRVIGNTTPKVEFSNYVIDGASPAYLLVEGL
jgi:hypothetical protein